MGIKRGSVRSSSISMRLTSVVPNKNNNSSRRRLRRVAATAKTIPARSKPWFKVRSRGSKGSSYVSSLRQPTSSNCRHKRIRLVSLTLLRASSRPGRRKKNRTLLSIYSNISRRRYLMLNFVSESTLRRGDCKLMSDAWKPASKNRCKIWMK